MNYPIIEIPGTVSDSIEQLGTKEKFWFFFDNTDKIPKLFKFGRIGTGENWAEKVACELAKLIELPCAEYDLAKWKGREGVITPLFVPKNGRLIHGNEILARIIKDYPLQKRYKINDYKLTSVLAIIKVVADCLPIGFKGNSIIQNSLDLFIGFLIFDCWIANQDRHHENWGIVLDTNDNTVHLTPSYDHASGFGCRVSDDEMFGRLSTSDLRYDIDAFAKKAKSPFYSLDQRRFSTIETVILAAKQNKEATIYWINKIEKISKDEILNIFQKIPVSINTVTVDFAMAILRANTNRLLEVKRELQNG